MVTVAAQATLTIMPGTVVRFGADSGIFVLGRLVAKGSAESPIHFSSMYSEAAPSDWYGVVLTGTAKKNVFEHVQMQGAETAIYARSSSLEVKQFRVENSAAAIKLADSIAYLKNIAITGCPSGLSSVKSELELESVVIDKAETAVSVTATALTASRVKISSSSQSAFVAEKSQLKIEKSTFSGNLTGAMVIGCEGSLYNSSFVANSETAVILSGSLLRFSSNLVSGSRIGLQLVDNMPVIWGNSLYANSTYNILYLGEGKLSAGGNWFGTATIGLISKSVYSKSPGALMLLPLLAVDPVPVKVKDF